MKVHEYENYEEYIAIQTDANKRKILRGASFVCSKTMELIKQIQPKANNILCHGTRAGEEQQFFKVQYPEAYVIGTEISDTATDYPDTIQHDFHKEMLEWTNTFDIVYSNSWDHSLYPRKSLTVWRNQLNKNGHLYIEHAYSKLNNFTSAVDPLEISHKEILAMFDECGLRFIRRYLTVGGGDNKKPCRLYEGRKK